MAGSKNVKDPKPIELDLGGKKRNLRFDLNAFAELEEYYGTIDGAMEALEKGSIKALRAIIWAGLLHEEPELKPSDVGSWIDIQDLPAFSETLGQALTAALPAPEEAKMSAPLKETGKEKESQS